MHSGINSAILGRRIFDFPDEPDPKITAWAKKCDSLKSGIPEGMIATADGQSIILQSSKSVAGLTWQGGIQFHARYPEPGRWVLTSETHDWTFVLPEHHGASVTAVYIVQVVGRVCYCRSHDPLIGSWPA